MGGLRRGKEAMRNCVIVKKRKSVIPIRFLLRYLFERQKDSVEQQFIASVREFESGSLHDFQAYVISSGAAYILNLFEILVLS